MINSLFQSFVLGLTAIASFVTGGHIEQAPPQTPQVIEAPVTLGAAPQFVSAKPTTLYGSGISSSATTITLTDLTVPNSNAPINFSTAFGSASGTKAYATLEPKSATKKEFISFTGITQNANGTAILTGVTRGLDFQSPYTASSTLRKSHAGGTSVVISNSPQFYQQIIDYINNATTSGAVDASLTVKGLVELATGLQAASSTSVGGGDTTAPLALHTGISTSSKPTSGHYIPITDINGSLGTFINSSTLSNITLSGTTTATGPTNIASSSMVIYTASTTWSKPADLKYIIIETIAGGGGGGGASGAAGRAGGGGGGGYCKNLVGASLLASTETVTVGAGGTAGASSPTSGGTGATSSFGTFCTSLGGGGGGSAGSNAGSGGGGGSASGGIVNATGGAGGSGAISDVGGSGGNSVYGGGGQGSSGNGGVGSQYGGGAGGGGNGNPGGVGGIGAVIITQYFF